MVTSNDDDNKMYRIMLKDGSLQVMDQIIIEMNSWKLINLNNEKNIINIYPFVKNWIYMNNNLSCYIFMRAITEARFSLLNFKELESESD